MDFFFFFFFFLFFILFIYYFYFIWISILISIFNFNSGLISDFNFNFLQKEKQKRVHTALYMYIRTEKGKAKQNCTAFALGISIAHTLHIALALFHSTLSNLVFYCFFKKKNRSSWPKKTKQNNICAHMNEQFMLLIRIRLIDKKKKFDNIKNCECEPRKGGRRRVRIYRLFGRLLTNTRPT